MATTPTAPPSGGGGLTPAALLPRQPRVPRAMVYLQFAIVTLVMVRHALAFRRNPGVQVTRSKLEFNKPMTPQQRQQLRLLGHLESP